jgi:hypothetical protein
LLVRSPNDPRKLLYLDILPHNGAFGLVLLVQRDLDDGSLETPAAGTTDELLKRLALHPQPRFQDGPLDFPHRLRDGERDPDPDQLFEAGDVGNQVGVEIIAVQGAPKCGVRRLAEKVVENVQLLDGLGERGIAGCWECGGGGDGFQDVRWEEVEGEREVGGRENGQALDEDVGDGLIFGEVRVELVPVEAHREVSMLSPLGIASI